VFSSAFLATFFLLDSDASVLDSFPSPLAEVGELGDPYYTPVSTIVQIPLPEPGAGTLGLLACAGLGILRWLRDEC